MKMRGFVGFITTWLVCGVASEIRESHLINKLLQIKPVGGNLAKNFVPLTELPPPATHHYHNGRRHFNDDCNQKPTGKEVFEGAKVHMFGEYYDDRVAKTVATIIIPDHIDHKHFEVTTQAPYLTVGPIEAIGYHPTTNKPNECEKIYQDHINEMYSDEDTDYSEESLEMARMPIFPPQGSPDSLEYRLGKMYSDMES